MKKIIFILVSITCISFSYGQETDKKLNNNHIQKIDDDHELYEFVFNYELNKYGERNSRHLYDILPEKLPSWFREFPVLPASHIIGISDPGMDSVTGYEQALLRGKSLFLLLRNSSFQNITDDYTNYTGEKEVDGYATKFHDYTKISSIDTSIIYNFSVVGQHITKYGETVLLIKANPDMKSPGKIKSTAEYMQIFVETGSGIDKIEFINISTVETSNDDDSVANQLSYQYKFVNQSFEILSAFNELNIDLPLRSYNYYPSDNLEFDTTQLSYHAHLKKGLWNSYISRFIIEMTSVGKNSPTLIKNTDDFYTKKNEGLIRTILSDTLTFNINYVRIKNNHLLVDLTGQNYP